VERAPERPALPLAPDRGDADHILVRFSEYRALRKGAEQRSEDLLDAQRKLAVMKSDWDACEPIGEAHKPRSEEWPNGAMLGRVKGQADQLNERTERGIHVRHLLVKGAIAGIAGGPNVTNVGVSRWLCALATMSILESWENAVTQVWLPRSNPTTFSIPLPEHLRGSAELSGYCEGLPKDKFKI
jgi:hypothetical protein